MNIHPVAGTGAPQSLVPASSKGGPESGEIPGAADHDGDADDAAGCPPAAPSPDVASGRVDLNA